MSKYKVIISHEKETDDIYCNDVSKDGDYLLLTHSKDVDYEIINLKRFERVRVQKVDYDA